MRSWASRPATCGWPWTRARSSSRPRACSWRSGTSTPTRPSTSCARPRSGTTASCATPPTGSCSRRRARRSPLTSGVLAGAPDVSEDGREAGRRSGRPDVEQRRDGSGAVSGYERVAQVFVELADTLVEEFDPLDFLQMLAERSVELLDVDAAALMLADRPGDLQLVVSTAPRAHDLEQFQLDV